MIKFLHKKLLTILLLLIFIVAVGLMVFSGIRDSATTDESIHLFSGYTYLTRGDFRLDPEHPPLLKELGALPLLFFKDLRVTFNGLWDQVGIFYYDSWQEARILAENFFFTWGNSAEKLLFWGRLPFIFLTLLLGLLGFFWAKKLYGAKAGILAAFLILFCPNILAHGRLINTDLGVTLFIFLAVFCWGNFLKKPNWLNFLFSGFSLGLVLAAKFTGIIIIPILIILGLIKILFFPKTAENLGKYLAAFFGIILISFLVVWASYGFSLVAPPPPLGSLSANIILWTGYNVPVTFDNLFGKMRSFLIPADFYKGLFLVLRHTFSGHVSYLLGASSNTGWWYYFPVVIFFKTPVAFFALLIITIIFWPRTRAKNLFDEVLLIVSPLVYLLLSMFSKADLGLRHVLPIFPFLFVFVSKSINLIDFSKRKILSFILIGSILWYALTAIFSFPNYLAYFNEFASGPEGLWPGRAGGSKNGYKIVADSNLDWGQDAYRIRKYLDEHNLSSVPIVYPWSGDLALEYYGISFIPLAEEGKVKGPVVISATYLQMENFSWLKKYPFKQITPGVFIFDVN